ncbi:MAG: M23 family metallopeptidase [Trueperaceae bacterium]|nr:M23 family metallopeptidase [Trueperaceae bacterium]
MQDARPGPKLGWYLLISLLAYAVIASVAWRGAVVELREARLVLAGAEAGAGAGAPAGAGTPAAAAATALGGDVGAASAGEAPAGGPPATGHAELAADVGLWFPVPGARVPEDDAHLPGAPRPYRSGVSEGFVFWPDGAGVPLAFGTPVIAAGSGEVLRVDAPYAELDEATWEALLVAVADGADEDQLDALRGRQVWIRLDDGRVLRYGHLSGVRPGLTVGQRVARGRVIGFAGNSGTFDGVVGRTANARLHFEIRDGDAFVGEGLDPDGVRLLAASLFTGP